MSHSFFRDLINLMEDKEASIVQEADEEVAPEANDGEEATGNEEVIFDVMYPERYVSQAKMFVQKLGTELPNKPDTQFSGMKRIFVKAHGSMSSSKYKEALASASSYMCWIRLKYNKG